MNPADTRLIAALAAENASTRLKAALALGSSPEPSHILVDTLITRCAIEPDFYVLDMLTWALTRFPSEITVPRLVAELGSEGAQARSQALHTLSKIKDRNAFPAITQSLLRDSDNDVARSACAPRSFSYLTGRRASWLRNSQRSSVAATGKCTSV